MLQWIAMAVLTAAASLAVLAPLHRARLGGNGRRAAAAIYRDQLAELDRDVARGVVAQAEAEFARAEIARRLLGETAAAEGSAPLPPHVLRIPVLMGAVGIPLAAVAIYLVLGEPAAHDAPLAARLSAPIEKQDAPMLLARVEAHLAAHPEDGRGWAIVAPVYAGMGRHADAANAYMNANRILGATAEREAALGQALTAANGGVETAEARAAFERSRTLALAEKNRVEPEGARGPAAGDIAAASGLSDAERASMIDGMVTSLAARLSVEPDDPEGWARLIRSYVVLGRGEEARAALARAREVFAGDADRLAALAELARSLGMRDG